MISGRVLFDLVLLAAATVGAFQAHGLPTMGQIGPGGFPITIMGLGMVVVLVILFDDLRHSGDRFVAAKAISLLQAVGMALIILLLAGYIGMLEVVGFFSATVGFLFLTTLLCTWLLDPPGQRAKWGSVALGAGAFSIVATAVSYLGFTVGLGLTFP